jgi:hypothetical protein
VSNQNSVSEYDKVIEALFFKKFNEANNPDVTEVVFLKDELSDVANSMSITVRNVPDVVYTYRSRCELPGNILSKGNWIIAPRGKGDRYP